MIPIEYSYLKIFIFMLYFFIKSYLQIQNSKLEAKGWKIMKMFEVKHGDTEL